MRELLKWAKDHYWDSLEQHKNIILCHLKAFKTPEEGREMNDTLIKSDWEEFFEERPEWEKAYRAIKARLETEKMKEITKAGKEFRNSHLYSLKRQEYSEEPWKYYFDRFGYKTLKDVFITLDDLFKIFEGRRAGGVKSKEKFWERPHCECPGPRESGGMCLYLKDELCTHPSNKPPECEHNEVNVSLVKICQDCGEKLKC